MLVTKNSPVNHSLRLQTVEHCNFFEYTGGAEEEAHDIVYSPNTLHIGVMLGAIVLVMMGLV